MRNIWMKITAMALVLLMLGSFVACGDEEEKPTTDQPSESSSQDGDETGDGGAGDEEEIKKPTTLNASEGLEYGVNKTGTTCMVNGLGTFEGTTVIIPDIQDNKTVIGIDINAFASDKAQALTEISIPSTVKNLGKNEESAEKNLFDNCTALKTVRYFGSESLWNQMLANAGIAEDYFTSREITVVFSRYFDLTVQHLYANGLEAKPAEVTTYISDTNYTVECPSVAGYRVDGVNLEGVITDDTTAIITYTKILADGRCGDDLTWCYYEDHRLDINGTGAMYDYMEKIVPWAPYISEIEEVRFDDTVTTLGAYVFANGTSIKEMTLPEGLESVGAYAFKNWTDDQSVLFSGGVNILTMMDAVWNNDQNASINFLYGRYDQDGEATTKEPLTWTVVAQEGDAYLLTMFYAVEKLPYNNAPVAVDWHASSLREWLINDFVTAFTEEELQAQVDIRKDIGVAGDNLFIFSASELARLFEEEILCVRKGTATSNPIEVVDADGNKKVVASEDGMYWWLRDNGALDNLAQNVTPDGVINTQGAVVSMTNRGVSVSVWVAPQA